MVSRVADRDLWFGFPAVQEYQELMQLGKGITPYFESVWNSQTFPEREIKQSTKKPTIKKTTCKFSQTLIGKIPFRNEDNDSVIAEWGKGGVAGAVGNSLWIAQPGVSKKQTLNSSAFINDLNWNPKEEALAVGYKNGDFKIWDVNSNKVKNKILHVEDFDHYSAAVQWENHFSLLVAYDEGQQTLNRYDTRTDKMEEIYEDKKYTGMPRIMGMKILQSPSENFVAMSFRIPNSKEMALVVVDHRMTGNPICNFSNPTAFHMSWGPSDILACASNEVGISLLNVNTTQLDNMAVTTTGFKSVGRSIDYVQWFDDTIVTLQRDTKGQEAVCYDANLTPISSTKMKDTTTNVLFSPGKNRMAHVKQNEVVITPGLRAEATKSLINEVTIR